MLTETYQQRLVEFEDFIWIGSGKNLRAVEHFLKQHEDALHFIERNPLTPPKHPQTGDQSWPFANGQFRIFFKIRKSILYLTDIIDNRMSNRHIYPENSLPTYEEDN